MATRADVRTVPKCTGNRAPVPNGLKELLEEMSREVLKHQPEDINLFLANYLEEKLKKQKCGGTCNPAVGVGTEGEGDLPPPPETRIGTTESSLLSAPSRAGPCGSKSRTRIPGPNLNAPYGYDRDGKPLQKLDPGAPYGYGADGKPIPGACVAPYGYGRDGLPLSKPDPNAPFGYHLSDGLPVASNDPTAPFGYGPDGEPLQSRDPAVPFGYDESGTPNKGPEFVSFCGEDPILAGQAEKLGATSMEALKARKMAELIEKMDEICGADQSSPACADAQNQVEAARASGVNRGLQAGDTCGEAGQGNNGVMYFGNAGGGANLLVSVSLDPRCVCPATPALNPLSDALSSGLEIGRQLGCNDSAGTMRTAMHSMLTRVMCIMGNIMGQESTGCSGCNSNPRRLDPVPVPEDVVTQAFADQGTQSSVGNSISKCASTTRSFKPQASSPIRSPTPVLPQTPVQDSLLLDIQEQTGTTGDTSSTTCMDAIGPEGGGDMYGLDGSDAVAGCAPPQISSVVPEELEAGTVEASTQDDCNAPPQAPPRAFQALGGVRAAQSNRMQSPAPGVDISTTRSCNDLPPPPPPPPQPHSDNSAQVMPTSVAAPSQCPEELRPLVTVSAESGSPPSKRRQRCIPPELKQYIPVTGGGVCERGPEGSAGSAATRNQAAGNKCSPQIPPRISKTGLQVTKPTTEGKMGDYIEDILSRATSIIMTTRQKCAGTAPLLSQPSASATANNCEDVDQKQEGTVGTSSADPPGKPPLICGFGDDRTGGGIGKYLKEIAPQYQELLASALSPEDQTTLTLLTTVGTLLDTIDDTGLTRMDPLQLCSDQTLSNLVDVGETMLVGLKEHLARVNSSPQDLSKGSSSDPTMAQITREAYDALSIGAESLEVAVGLLKDVTSLCGELADHPELMEQCTADLNEARKKNEGRVKEIGEKQAEACRAAKEQQARNPKSALQKQSKGPTQGQSDLDLCDESVQSEMTRGQDEATGSNPVQTQDEGEETKVGAEDRGTGGFNAKVTDTGTNAAGRPAQDFGNRGGVENEEPDVYCGTNQDAPTTGIMEKILGAPPASSARAKGMTSSSSQPTFSTAKGRELGTGSSSPMRSEWRGQQLAVCQTSSGRIVFITVSFIVGMAVGYAIARTLGLFGSGGRGFGGFNLAGLGWGEALPLPEPVVAPTLGLLRPVCGHR